MKHDFLKRDDLIPPTNPNYPWVADNWQLLCYYCAEPIFFKDGQHQALYRQRHYNKGCGWHHYSIDGPVMCDPKKIRPTEEIDDPRCHCCGMQSPGPHLGICSVGGFRNPQAETLDEKEQEIERYFGGYGRIGLLNPKTPVVLKNGEPFWMTTT